MLNKSALSSVKSVARNLSIVTFFYLLALPFVLYMHLFSMMVFGNPNMTPFGGLTIIGLALTIPTSIPIAIFFMWRRFNQRQYSKAYFYCITPFLVGFVSYGLIEIIGNFFFR